MPVSPPKFEHQIRFDPVYVTTEDLEDLATFTGMDPDSCLRGLQLYATSELAEEWLRANPSTREEILNFYRSSELQIWALMQWHASADRRPYWQALTSFVDRYQPAAGYRRVLDFGCGVGTDSLFLASHGYDVTLVDAEGPTLRFARHRFARRGISARFADSAAWVAANHGGQYDAVVCFDVFEHLPDPVGTARQLVARLRPGGILLQKASFGAEHDHPFHLGDGVHRFEGLRWHIYLARLGLRGDGPFAYSKLTGWSRIAQRIRHEFWHLTGFWIFHVSRKR